VSLTRANALTAMSSPGPRQKWPIRWNVDPLQEAVGNWRRGLQSADGPRLRVQPSGGARVQFAPGDHAGIGARQPRRSLITGHTAGRPGNVRSQDPAYKIELLRQRSWRPTRSSSRDRT